MKRKSGAAGKKTMPVGDHRSRHGSLVTATFGLLDGPQACFVAVRKPDGIDVYVELASASHASLRVRVGYGAPGDAALWDHLDVTQLDGIQHLEIHPITGRCVGRTDAARDTHADGSAFFQDRLAIGCFTTVGALFAGTAAWAGWT
jgi:hypothetical protein